MGPQDKVERVLKEIHVLFSKSESYQGKPDKVVVDRRKFLELLDRLNKGIFDMMDTYEHTRESRQRAELAFENKGKEMLADAEEKAEDVYAASVIYTANMLGEVQRLIDQANESINDVFVQFKRELRTQKETVKSNELELQSQLNILADAKTYQEMLAEVRREQRKQHRMEDLAKRQLEAEGPAYIQQGGQIYIPATSADVKVNEEYFEKQGISAENAKAGYIPAPAPLAVEKPEVKVNLNSEYFKRKAAAERTTRGENDESEDVQLEHDIELDLEYETVNELDGPLELDDDILRELAELEAEVEREPEPKFISGKRGPTITLECKTKSQQKEIFKEVSKKEKKWMEQRTEPIPTWKSRMKTLVNEILPKDIHEK